MKRVSREKENATTFLFNHVTYRVIGGAKGWPCLATGGKFGNERTKVRQLLFRPDCLLQQVDKANALVTNKPKAIAIEVCKSWQNFMSKRFQYSKSNAQHLEILTSSEKSIKPKSIEAVYALAEDGEDWLLSRVVNMPSCGGFFCDGVDSWDCEDDIDIQLILDLSKPRDMLASDAAGRPTSELSRIFPSVNKLPNK